MTFIEKLSAAWEKSNSLLCVGLDPDTKRFPEYLRGQPDSIFAFCKNIIDSTADLEDICSYIRENYPDIPVILDAKRGDIGATAQQYAREVFERYNADAVTLSPYMGFDSVEPYLEYTGKGAIVLARTSNPGGSDLQFLKVSESGKTIPLYQHVAHLVAEKWNTHGQCALVVGATFPHEIAEVRSIIGDMPLLIPGIGAQGGDIEATVNAGRTANGRGMMINSSRAILYAGIDQNENYASVSRQAAIKTRDEINRFR